MAPLGNNERSEKSHARDRTQSRRKRAGGKVNKRTKSVGTFASDKSTSRKKK